MNKPSPEQTIKAAKASAETMMDHAKQVLDPEDLLLYGIYTMQLTELAQRLLVAGKRKVWMEVLASMNHMEDNAEKFFGPEIMREANS